MKYHLNPQTGEINECTATEKPCRFLQTSKHFDSLQEAETFLSKEFESTGIHSKSKKISLDLPPELHKVVDDLSEIGQPLIVGGAVRDSILGVENKDFDIEVHGTNIDALVSHLKAKGFRVDEVGKQFGVLKAYRGKVRDLDISVPRRENRTGAGHRSFEVELDNLSYEEAAQRRDFTFNAIMYDPKTGRSIDPSGGQKDLENRTLRHVSDKFKEDPLRVLRGFQFGARFNMRYAPDTSEMARSIRDTYSDLSVERVREEWAKFYTKGTNHNAGVRALQDSGWDDTEPGLRDSLQDPTVQKDLSRLTKAEKPLRSEIGGAVISREMSSKDRDRFLDRTAVTKDSAKKTRQLIESTDVDLSTVAARKHYAFQKKATFKELSEYAKVRNDKGLMKRCLQAKQEGIFEKPEKDLVNGNEVMEATGRPPGRWMKGALDAARTPQYEGRAKTSSDALKEAIEYSERNPE